MMNCSFCFVVVVGLFLSVSSHGDQLPFLLSARAITQRLGVVVPELVPTKTKAQHLRSDKIFIPKGSPDVRPTSSASSV